jgi:hypothetical protein
MKPVLVYFSYYGCNVSILRVVGGLQFGVGSLRISINPLPPSAISNFLYIEDPKLRMIFAPPPPPQGPMGVRTNEDRQEHELRFTARQRVSALLLSLGGATNLNNV